MRASKDWLAEIADTPAGMNLRRLFATYPILDALMAGLAESSPHLWGLARAEPERLVALLEAEPERRFNDILAGARGAIAAAPDEAAAMRLLRRMKTEAALLIALADIGGVWPVMRVVELQTMLADAAVGAAVDYLLGDARRHGKLDIVESGAARTRLGLYRACDGQDGRGRAQLFERHRSHRLL